MIHTSDLMVIREITHSHRGGIGYDDDTELQILNKMIGIIYLILDTHSGAYS